jgi:hypothetical protein
MTVQPQIVLEQAAQDLADATAKPPFQAAAFLRDALGTA